LQVKLDACAQHLFGERNPRKQLLPPRFTADGPQLRNTLNLDGGYAELGFSAAGDWPLAIFQLAHETIHLLDPRPGYTDGKGATWLEEGLAVNFSLTVSKALGNFSIKVSDKRYQTANNLFTRIGGDIYQRSKQIRNRSGHFSDVSLTDLSDLSPNLPQHIAIKLVSSFYF
jgi:hypothetical protein